MNPILLMFIFGIIAVSGFIGYNMIAHGINKMNVEGLPYIPVLNSVGVQTKPSLSLDELRQIVLDDINKYRQEKQLSILVLGSAKSPQLYAKELFGESCIHHISLNGVGPMLRYKNNNDVMFLVSENISGGNLNRVYIEDVLKDANYRMMFEDAHANWGHRDNILNPEHASVSIGISFDNNSYVLVEDFEHSLPIGYDYHEDSFKIQDVDEKFCW